MLKKMGFIKRAWFRVLISGLALFFATEQVLKVTENPNLIPTVILLGAFIVPVAFITYIYGYEPVKDVSLPTVALSFLWGGIIGIAAAGLLEYETLKSLTFLALLGVAVIEELVKLIFPLVLYVQGRYRSEAHGLLFGITSGMAFAALETMGYGLVALIKSQGNIGALEDVLLVRGLLSPAGHAAWTGLVCSVIWRERARGHPILNRTVIGTFALVVILHALWDFFDILPSQIPSWSVISTLANLAIAAISLVLLIRRIRESARVTPELVGCIQT
jgi:RsiW-degrading membrane proteinase PrsW (M82 family)